MLFAFVAKLAQRASFFLPKVRLADLLFNALHFLSYCRAFIDRSSHKYGQIISKAYL